MKQLRNFKNNSSGSNQNNGKHDANPVIDEAMKRYGGMGEDELINQLLASVRNSRANGTYNPTQMNSYVQMLRSHVSPEQYEKIQNIINLINSENV